MNYIVINKLITKSIYKQIADSITKSIESGILSYNDRLPTEKEICRMFSISQTAVKMAYDKLITEGKIVRIKGKGTYVTNRSRFKTDLHTYFKIEISENEYQNQTILLDRSAKDKSAVRELQLVMDERYLLVVSLYSSINNPKLLQRIYLPEKMYEKFNKYYNEKHNVFQIIEEDYHYEIKELLSTFSTINASASDALLLNLKQDDAIYSVRTKIIDVNEKVVGYICNYYPGEFTEFEVIVNAI